MAYPRFRASRAHKFYALTTGNKTITSTTWANLDTATDLVLAARVDDWIEVGASGLWGNEAAYGYLDVASIVASAVVNTWGTQGAETAGGGIMGWSYGSGIVSPALYPQINGGTMKKIVSGDLSGGVVTLRLRVRESGGNKTLFANTTDQFHWWAKNISPADGT